MKPTNAEGAAVIRPVTGWVVEREGCALYRATIYDTPDGSDATIKLFISKGRAKPGQPGLGSTQVELGSLDDLADLIEGLQVVQHAARERGRP